MKKFALILSIALLSSINLLAQDPAAPGTTPAGTATPAAVTPAPLPTTTITWNETVYNFGVIEQGVPVRHKFEFTVTGDNDLVITEVKRTCGCTSLEWIKTPVKKGETGWVEAEFNAAAAGMFSKTIFFNANVEPNPVGLTFQGEVKPKEQLNLNNQTILSTDPNNKTTPTPPQPH